MRPMNPLDDGQDVLKTIEAAIITVSRDHSEMTNYNALRAYEAAISHYNALARGHQPKPVAFSGLDDTTFQAVYKACEERLGKPVSEDPSTPLLNAEDLVACLPDCVNPSSSGPKKGDAVAILILWPALFDRYDRFRGFDLRCPFVSDALSIKSAFK